MDYCKSKTETRLLQSLNKFIALLAHLGTQPQNTSSSNAKVLANYLRLNLLSRLRHLQTVSEAERPLDSKERDLLVQWWITLLNFLNSDGRSQEHDEIPPLLTIEVCSVALESVSRIMTLTGLAASNQRELDICAYHTLLTVHYVTNRLIFNTKKRKFLMSTKQLPLAHTKQQLRYYNQYNQLLNSFMGKLMAYAFFFLDKSFEYDSLLLRFLEPNVCAIDRSFPAFPWKTKNYKIGGQGSRTRPSTTLADQDKKMFQVVISYLRNDTIFMAFYWHYWHIALSIMAARNIEKVDKVSIPGCQILIRYVTKNLDSDFAAFSRFLKSQENDCFQHTRPTGHISLVTSEQTDNFVFVNFKTVKLWECIRSLTGCLHPNMPDLLCDFIKIHDDILLKKLAKIPAYDYQLGNLIYNRLLQFILFQFYSLEPYLSAFNWAKWCQGLTSMLQTLNVNCQCVALVSLFNIWDYIPTDQQVRSDVISTLVAEWWESLAQDTIFDVIRILFFKIVVFRVLNSTNPALDVVKSRVVENLQAAHQRAVSLAGEVPTDLYPSSSTDALLFHINRKLILSKYDSATEDTLLTEHELNNNSAKEKERSLLLPSVIMTASVRPLFILSQGRYPFDVLDEMVIKASKKAAKQRNQNSKSDNKTSRTLLRRESGNSSSKSSVEITVEEEADSSVVSAFGSFLSKFGNSSMKSSKKTKGSLAERFTRSTSSGSSRLASEPPIALDGKQDSESVEMISMFSSLSGASSLSANKSGSSLELRTHQSISKESSTSRRSSIKEGQEDAAQPQKKKKLLAPPELKFSGEIVKAEPVKWMFRTLIVPMSGSVPSAVLRVQKANDKWGIVTARNYDKPLPSTNDTSAEGSVARADLSVLTGEINNMSVSESLSMGSSNDINQSIIPSRQVVPQPYLLDLGINQSPSSYSHDADQFTLTSAKSENTTEKRHDSHHISKTPSASKTPLTMRQGTELGQLVKMITVFNDTVSERLHFMDMVQYSGQRLMLDPELSTFRNSQNSHRNLDNARIEYM
ncbi:LAFA_0G11870g1_1 [Lachancea sp. 'fantastica']|nr:LAFA_0G11870g1_1 [Lachancea sp. 'fantastica']